MENKSKNELIYDSGIKLFGKFGVKRVSIDMIVKDAQIAKGTFYLYYKNKGELYEKIIEDILIKGKEHISYLHDSIIDIKERFFKHMICSLGFFEKNDIIRNIITGNKDYHIGNINSEYLYGKHLEILRLLFGKEFDNKEKIIFISEVKGFFVEVLNMKKHFSNKDKYEKFVLNLAAILTNGLFSDYNTLHKGKTYAELQEIK